MESGRRGPLCLSGLVHLVGYSRGGTCSIPFAFAAEPSPPRGGTSLSSSSSDDGHWVVLTVDWGTEAHNLQVESYILFRDLAGTQSRGDSPSEMLLPRGEGRARTCRSYCWKKAVELTVKRRQLITRDRCLKAEDLVLF